MRDHRLEDIYSVITCGVFREHRMQMGVKQTQHVLQCWMILSALAFCLSVALFKRICDIVHRAAVQFAALQALRNVNNPSSNLASVGCNDYHEKVSASAALT